MRLEDRARFVVIRLALAGETADHFIDGPNGEIALGHNGNIINADLLRSELEAEGRIFETSTDSEVIAHLVATAPLTWAPRVGGGRLVRCMTPP